MSDITLTDIERRVLAYLDQHGPKRRADVVVALASPDSDIGYRRDKYGAHSALRGSDGGVALIMGRWCKRLEAAGLVKLVRSEDRYWQYRHHEITAAGRAALRT